ncbi:MAG: ribonuclease P protein subunit [Thermoplasmata archaeon]|nr:MAG: ribonuclease P protein subunit [Thermoplasmata archaeon]
MNRTRHNIHRHELIGLNAHIIQSTDETHVNLKGKIVDETKNTLTIEVSKAEKKIPKEGTVIAVGLGDEVVQIDTTKLTYRPEDRIKKASKRAVT